MQAEESDDLRETEHPDPEPTLREENTPTYEQLYNDVRGELDSDDRRKTEQIEKLAAGIERTEAWLQSHKEVLAQCPGRAGDALSDLTCRQYMEVTEKFTDQLVAAREDLRDLIADREQSREINRAAFEGWEPPSSTQSAQESVDSQRTTEWLDAYKESLRDAPVRSGSELAGVLDRHFHDADTTARSVEPMKAQELKSDRDLGMEL